jgi:uncharacterized protein YuzE
MTERPQMKEPYLEVTFRHGRPLAAYLYLPRRSDQQVQGTRQAGEGLVVDLDRDGVPVGIEITAPGKISLASLNELLRHHHLPEVTQADVDPLLAA